MSYLCKSCGTCFKSSRALNTHLQRQSDCRAQIQYPVDTIPLSHNQNFSNDNDDDAKDSYCNDNSDIDSILNFFVSDNEKDIVDSDDDDKSIVSNKNSNMLYHHKSLFEQYIKHQSSGYSTSIFKNKHHTASIELLEILKKANTPLYLFDDIIKWSKKAAISHKIDFFADKLSSRQNIIKSLMNAYDLNKLTPIMKNIVLKGSLKEVTIVTHCFKQCIYSLLSDINLMNPDNLLISKTDPYNKQIPKKSYIIDDINSGSVFRKALDEYIDIDSFDALCPIIFFIDKTHTDNNGRWCLEQVRFTLGIFNRKTRNLPSAWRTLGYIPDQQHIKTLTSALKSIDYHHMIEIILQDFKKYQLTKIYWEVKFDNSYIPMNFKFPILFIIGDCEGHNKLASRYTSSNRVKRLCRYCNCSFDNTDDPFVKFTYTNHNQMFQIMHTGNASELQNLSIHCVDNAFEHLKYCDSDRGLFGSLCADVLHTIQLGLYDYFLEMIFLSKEIKDKAGEIEEEEEFPILSKFNVFSDKYNQRFDMLSKNYGYYLMHQSDRNLPRTHFQTNYKTNTRKNANEMSGIILVILIIFSSKEGEIVFDSNMNKQRATNIIHLIELLLLFENFCLSAPHSRTEIMQFKQFIPLFMDTYKTIINRTVGNKLKIIKFHLLKHFGDDILRFGSMKNFDSAIGESHHKTDAKKPAKNTQKRKNCFEYQTALRQLENLSISMGHNDVDIKIGINEKNCNDDSSWYRYIYTIKDSLCFYKNQNQKHLLQKCKWKDFMFQKLLINLCNGLLSSNNIEEPLHFFTLYNNGTLFLRGDPNYKDQSPWYDWVEVTWSEGIIPAKILLFIDIKANQLKGKISYKENVIIHPGKYAIIYSLRSTKNVIKAHGISLMVQYGKFALNNNPLYLIPVESIHGCISAVPYVPDDDIVTAIEWLFLRPKVEWYSILTKYMDNVLDDNTTNNLKRKLN
jgi:hypothetical protein